MAVLATAGSTVRWLREVSVLGGALRDGPQGLPVNKSARPPGSPRRRPDPAYRLTVAHGGAAAHAVGREELLAMPQRTETLPIACVEGWSASGEWTGVRVRDLLDLVGCPRRQRRGVESLQEPAPSGPRPCRPTSPTTTARCVALRLDGEPLSLDHGYPCRVIAPNRPGVLQTKWCRRVVADVMRRALDRWAWSASPSAAYGGWLLLDPPGRRAAGRRRPVAGRRGGAPRRRAGAAGAGPRGASPARGCPRSVRAPAAVALVVLGSVTLLAVPVLGRFGARPDNPTLLDRDYSAGWLVARRRSLVVASSP